jgi:predicted transcriptional regulator
MRLSSNEIKALVYVIESEGAFYRNELIKALGLHPETVSRVVTRLVNRGLVARLNDEIILARTSPAEAFKKLYYARRASPFHQLLADRRIDLLFALDRRPKSVEVLSDETGFELETIYRYLKDFIHLGVVTRTKKSRAFLYSFNYLLWADLKDFVTSLLVYCAWNLVPQKALLIKSYGGSVLFKSLRKRLNATPTSFSVFGEYGIKLGMRDYYYTLPKRELSIKEIFIHSLDSAEDLRQRLFCILFYLKYKDKLEDVEHPMMEEIKAVLKGEKIKGYPSVEDIKERATLYEIKL